MFVVTPAPAFSAENDGTGVIGLLLRSGTDVYLKFVQLGLV